MTRTLIVLALAALLSGCAGFTLGSFNYCAKDSACETEVVPFRPAGPVPAGSAGAASAAALSLVK